ncbi:6-pyruvoyltetrahydropterin/6-carboxytetrahydropterin synthase [Anaerolineae bacterium]|nr:6-pyruvoyltetrahydropterin/6-carboxytetrahydropterin synthase [Anaerolineae bacterium]
MYELSVQGEFCAAHSLVVGGVREPMHGHTFRVRACVCSAELDTDGFVCDFHLVQESLGGILADLSNCNLQEHAAFGERSPTAEHIARHIHDALAQRLQGKLGGVAWVSSVSVTEAPGCEATYRVERPADVGRAGKEAEPG